MTNILLQFLTTARADSKRFEMLSLLSTILSWDDSERERAGLQRGAKRPPQQRRKSSAPRTAEDEAAQAAMNESFSNLFVEFLLKEASQGEATSPSASTAPSSAFSPRASGVGLRSHYDTMSPPGSGSGTPGTPRAGARTMSSSSLTSIGESPTQSVKGIGITRKPSFGLQEAMGRQ